VADEAIEMFDRCLTEAYARAGQDLEDFRTAMADATNEKVYLFRELARAVLDPAIADLHLRRRIYQRVTPAVLRRAVDESDRIVRPLDDNYFDFFETRYGYLRQFTSTFLEAFTFHQRIDVFCSKTVGTPICVRIPSPGRYTAAIALASICPQSGDGAGGGVAGYILLVRWR
jgi:hypothetical protein